MKGVLIKSEIYFYIQNLHFMMVLLNLGINDLTLDCDFGFKFILDELLKKMEYD